MSASERQTKNWKRFPFCHLRLNEERVSELLEVATEVFLEHGFESASTNEIARRANCSKTTLYARFPTKQDLFIAVLERRAQRLFKELFAALPLDGPLEERLMEFGARILRISLADDLIRLQRVVSMQAERFPELARRFYEIGPKRAVEKLSGYLREQIKRNVLLPEDPHLMAEHLIALITSGPGHWKILGNCCNYCPKEDKQHLQAAVKTFLRAYGLNHK